MSRLHRNAELERRIQERLETRMAARWERKLRSTLRKASREAAAEYSRGASIDAAVQKQNADIKKALEAMYEQAFTSMGERIDQQWQSAKGYRPTGKKEMSDTFLRAMRAFITRWVAKKVVDISSTTVNILQGVVQSSIEDGLSVAETAKIIRQKGEQFAGYRANLIARTEIHSASQAGSLSATQQVGGDIIKEWVPVMDDRTRDGDNSDFDHTNVASVPLNEPFIVSGEALMYPGDPAGSAGSVINCRCAMTYIMR